jgi:hypothetical protein
MFVTGCLSQHHAELQTRPIAPLQKPVVHHSTKLWIDLGEAVDDQQCAEHAGYQDLCFENVQAALETSLSSFLWPSFPEVALRSRWDELSPTDYLLQVELEVEALPPDVDRPGWSAGANGRWRLVRGGFPLLGEELASTSSADFAYGSGLGRAGSEVVAAVASHIAEAVVRVPERLPLPAGEPLRVAARSSFQQD